MVTKYQNCITLKGILIRGSFFMPSALPQNRLHSLRSLVTIFWLTIKLLCITMYYMERRKEAILIRDTTSIRLTEEDEARIDKISKIIYDETQIVVTRSEIIRLGLRKLEKEYQKN